MAEAKERPQIALDKPYIIRYKDSMTPRQIRRTRKLLGLTQQQLADLIGARQHTVARWETGVNAPRGANLKILQELAEKVKKKTKKKRGGRKWE